MTKDPPPPPHLSKIWAIRYYVCLPWQLPEEGWTFPPPDHWMVFCLLLREWYPGPLGSGGGGEGLLLFFCCLLHPQHLQGRIGLGFLEFTTHTREGVEPPEDGTTRQKSTWKQKIAPSHVLKLMLKWSPGVGGARQSGMCWSGAQHVPSSVKTMQVYVFKELSCPLTSLKHYFLKDS